jgi:hypothetical protein
MVGTMSKHPKFSLTHHIVFFFLTLCLDSSSQTLLHIAIGDLSLREIEAQCSNEKDGLVSF